MRYKYISYSYENRCCLCTDNEILQDNSYGPQYKHKNKYKRNWRDIQTRMYKAKSYPLLYFCEKHLNELEEIDCDFAMGLEATG